MAGTRIVFQWDEANRSHLARHRVTPEEFEQGMRNGPIQLREYEIDGEWRIKVIVITDSDRLLEAAYTPRNGRIRAVTAYPLKKRRREYYRGQFKK